MTAKPFNRILLTNDDGIDAKGITVLAEFAVALANDVWIIAPEHDRSGISQALSLNSPIQAFRRGEKSFAVTGTPSDCVAMAIGHFMVDTPPDLVISGVNAGANIGEEINISGTIGAALTAHMLGFPSIAISQETPHRDHVPWHTTTNALPRVFSWLLGNEWDRKTCIAISIPMCHPDEIKSFSWARPRQDTISGLKVFARKSPRERDYYWIKLERCDGSGGAHDGQTDREILNRNEVAMMKLGLDRSIA